MSRLTRTLVGATAAALILGAPTAAVAASGGHGHGKGKGHSATHENHGKSKSHFTANGKVVSVADGTLTLHAKGGSKDLHGTDVTVSVPDTAKVRVNGDKGALTDLAEGDRVNVVGARTEDGLVAKHVNGHHKTAADDSTDATEGTDDGAVDDGTVDDGTTTDGTTTDGTTTDGTTTDGTTGTV